MSKILLLDPSGSYAQDKRARKLRPDIGLAYIASSLLAEKHEVRVMDMSFRTRNELVDQLLTWKPDITGISSMTFSILDVYGIAKFVRKTYIDTTIVLGGVHITALPQRTMEECMEIDIGVLGEGEKTICEIAEGNGLDQIRGIIYRDKGNVRMTTPHRMIRDLNSLPFPAWHLFELNKYAKTYSRRFNTFLNILMIIGSRGCPDECTFCYRTGGTRSVRFRSPKNVVDEIVYNFETFGSRFFHFGDSSMLMKRSFFEPICNKLFEKKLGKEITWVCEARPNQPDSEKMALLKKAGCEYLYLGIESGSQKILDLMKKRTTKGQIRNAVRSSKASGVPVGGNFLLGHPGETRNTMEESLRFAIELNLDDCGFNILDLYPGTELWQRAEQGGEAGWRLSSDIYDWEKRTRRDPHILFEEIGADELVSFRDKAEKTVNRQKVLKNRGLVGLLFYQLRVGGAFILKKLSIFEFVLPIWLKLNEIFHERLSRQGTR